MSTPRRGGLLLALPQLYGVGYPVIDKAVSGHIVLAATSRGTTSQVTESENI